MTDAMDPFELGEWLAARLGEQGLVPCFDQLLPTIEPWQADAPLYGFIMPDRALVLSILLTPAPHIYVLYGHTEDGGDAPRLRPYGVTETVATYGTMSVIDLLWGLEVQAHPHYIRGLIMQIQLQLNALGSIMPGFVDLDLGLVYPPWIEPEVFAPQRVDLAVLRTIVLGNVTFHGHLILG